MATFRRQATLSIGRLATLWQVCKHSDGASSINVIRARAERVLDAAASLFSDAVNLGLILGLVTQDIDRLKLTRYSNEVYDWDSEFPTPVDYRLLLLRFIERVRPLWALNAALPRPAFIATLEPPLIECLLAAEVIKTDQEPEWWKAVSGIIEGWERIDLAAIGRYAEELTLSYERQRLKANGLSDLADRIRWISQESDAYGYDVLSFCGDHAPLFNASKTDPLRIEVKGTARRSASVSFFITRNEWKVASFPEGVPYCFYIWRRPQLSCHPMIRTADSIRPFLPSDTSKRDCRWTECHVTIPVADNR